MISHCKANVIINIQLSTFKIKKSSESGADPGLFVGGGADPLGVNNFVKISEKLHEMEKILGRGGGVRRGQPP